MSKTPTAPSLCPECRAPAAEGARVCATHGLYVVTPAALEKLDEAPLLGGGVQSQGVEGEHASSQPAPHQRRDHGG